VALRQLLADASRTVLREAWSRERDDYVRQEISLGLTRDPTDDAVGLLFRSEGDIAEHM
jgi:hypothetical protein